MHTAIKHWITEEEEHDTAIKDPPGMLSGDLAHINCKEFSDCVKVHAMNEKKCEVS
jgi:hypothetical protein